jgi:hypothetical protein
MWHSLADLEQVLLAKSHDQRHKRRDIADLWALYTRFVIPGKCKGVKA